MLIRFLCMLTLEPGKWFYERVEATDQFKDMADAVVRERSATRIFTYL